MSAGHLSCGWCRVRVLAHAEAIELLEARCPICEAALAPTPASSVIGFRLFDLNPFAEHESRTSGGDPASPARLLEGRAAPEASGIETPDERHCE